MPKKIYLRNHAHARSGDKGNSSNIGVIANSPDDYDLIKVHLTADRVKEFFHRLGVCTVKRYELPNLGALNFVLEGALDGGGSRSLRTDAQGKALGQAILEMQLDIKGE